MVREDLLARTFLELSDVSVDNSDPTQVSQLLAQRCVELFDTSAAGVLLAGPDGDLWILGSSSESMRATERSELQFDQGPCLECYRTHKPVVAPDTATTKRRWPRFAPAALAGGFSSVHAVPIHVQGRIIGALNLFRRDVGKLSDADMLAAELLARAMAIAVERQSMIEQAVAGQLQISLEDQVVTEQAKGVLAGQAGVAVGEAYDRLRVYARHHGYSLSRVCHEVVEGSLSLTTFEESRVHGPRSR